MAIEYIKVIVFRFEDFEEDDLHDTIIFQKEDRLGTTCKALLVVQRGSRCP